ncbi:MAG: hypothetical protein HXY43_14975 [Fischerella sp.]|uniref:hypothetical protein n=1 Tax=Fischerella sp. TaxID=1191 RepID=UPI0018212869|nr:hypothetical protein [Fischerella sp.]NWF60522.1 hypothetical protein [Fischerella sp.]
MLTNQKFLNFALAGIAALSSILATSSRVQAEQSFNRIRVETDSAVVRIDGRSNDRRDRRYCNYVNRRTLAQIWESRRWQRYNRCVRHNHPRRCQYILRERNPYHRYLWY